MGLKKRQNKKLLITLGLLCALSLFFVTEAFSATSTSSTSVEDPNKKDNDTGTYYERVASTSQDGEATHDNRRWQQLETIANGASNPPASEYGVFWSTDGGNTWGHDDLFVDDTVTFQFNMHKDTPGTHYGDFLKGWIGRDGNSSFDASEEVIFKEEKVYSEYYGKGDSRNVYSGLSDFSYEIDSFVVTEDMIEKGLFLRARVACSDSLLRSYYIENNHSDWYSWNDQFDWNGRETTTSWWKSYKDMFVAANESYSYYQGEVEEWQIGVSHRPSSPTPEPATMVLFGFGLLGVASIGRKKLSV